MPSKKRKPEAKSATRNNTAAEHSNMRSLVRTVWEGALVHCYLECGHLITLHKEELGETATSIECWACEASNKDSPSA